jgi:hypothetical protein
MENRGLVECTGCGKPISRLAKTCPRCGSQTPPQPPPIKRYVHCEGCGKSLDIRAWGCPNCEDCGICRTRVKISRAAKVTYEILSSMEGYQKRHHWFHPSCIETLFKPPANTKCPACSRELSPVTARQFLKENFEPIVWPGNDDRRPLNNCSHCGHPFSYNLEFPRLMYPCSQCQLPIFSFQSVDGRSFAEAQRRLGGKHAFHYRRPWYSTDQVKLALFVIVPVILLCAFFLFLILVSYVFSH